MKIHPSKNKQNKLIIIYTTLPNKTIAQKFAKELIQTKLAACVNIIPNIQSFYFWNNKVCTDQELILWIKAKAQNSKKIEAFLNEKHPYEVPVICQLEPKKVSDKYLNWALGVTSHRQRT